MMDDLIKLMVERWYLPEDQVRKFLQASFGENGTSLSLEQLREQTSSLLQDLIIQSIDENKNPAV